MGHQIHKVCSVAIVDAYTLKILFEDNFEQTTDFEPVLWGRHLRPVEGPCAVRKSADRSGGAYAHLAQWRRLRSRDAVRMAESGQSADSKSQAVGSSGIETTRGHVGPICAQLLSRRSRNQTGSNHKIFHATPRRRFFKNPLLGFRCGIVPVPERGVVA